MSSYTHRTNGEQFAAMGYASQQQQYQQQYRHRPSSDYPGFVSTTQQPAGPPGPGSSALGILADVALARGRISDFGTGFDPNYQQTTTGYVQSGGGGMAAMNMNLNMNTNTHMNANANMNAQPPVFHSYFTGPPPPPPPPVMYFTPSTAGEYTQNRPANPHAMSGNTYPSTACTSRTGSTQRAHTSYNQLPSISRTAADLRSFAVSGPSTMPRSVNGGSNSRPSSAAAAKKKKSSYIIDQMERLDKIEKDRVGRVRDRTNYFAYSKDQENTVAASAGDSEDDTRDNHDKGKGKEKNTAGKSERESTRDMPGDKYVRMFQEPEQQRYEEAMLKILDGMELPRSFGQ